MFFTVLMLASAVAADDKKDTGKLAALERFKQLSGEWTGKEVEGIHPGQQVNANYKVTAGGSAVVETLFPGTEHEMVTVIQPDGADLVLTHY